MKDYTYYIPGYTGFCPELPQHYGQSYGKATRQIIRERPRDLLKERLSDVRHRCHPDRRKDHRHGHGGMRTGHNFDSHCMDYSNRHCGRGMHSDDQDRDGAIQFDIVYPAVFYFEGHPDQMPEYSKEQPHHHHEQPHHHHEQPHHHHGQPRRHHEQPHRHHEQPHHHHKHDRGDMPHGHHPGFMTEPCQQDEAPCDRHGYDSEARTRTKVKKVPFRHCCVTPKYSGHIPGMQFVFGESFGVASDRLLRRHHDNMKRMNTFR